MAQLSISNPAELTTTRSTAVESPSPRQLAIAVGATVVLLFALLFTFASPEPDTMPARQDGVVADAGR